MDIFIVKENLINSLCSSLVPHILDGFMSIYEDAVRVNPNNSYEQNKRFLLDIKNWPEKIITTEAKRIISQFKMLRKILKTINFINIKSLALIVKNNIQVDDAYISQNTPSVVTFVHNIYVNASKEFFHDEQLMNFGMTGTRGRQGSVVETVIKRCLNECVPMHELLLNIVDETEDIENIQVPIKIETKPYIQQRDEKEKQSIILENTRNNNTNIEEDTLDLLDDTLNCIKEESDEDTSKQDKSKQEMSESKVTESKMSESKEEISESKDEISIATQSNSIDRTEKGFSDFIDDNSDVRSLVASNQMPLNTRTNESQNASNSKTMRSLRDSKKNSSSSSIKKSVVVNS